MEQAKVTILKKDGDFYYRIRKDKKLVTVARIVRNTSNTSKIQKNDHKYNSFVNEMSNVFAKWQKSYSICITKDVYQTLTEREQQQLNNYLNEQLITINEQLIQMYEEQKKQILQDFEFNFDQMLQQIKDRVEDYKHAKLRQFYMKFYCLKNKNGNYSIRAKLDGVMTEFARLSKREIAPNAEVWLPSEDNKRKTVQSKGFLSLEEELNSVLRKWLGSYVPVLTSKVVALSKEEAEMLFVFLQKTLDDINTAEYDKLCELQRSESVENTVTEIMSGIEEQGSSWDNNILKQYEDKLKSYPNELKNS